MKIEGYEEISFDEYVELPANEGIKVDDAYNQKVFYYKKAQKFPICFRLDSDHNVNVLYNGGIDFKISDEVVFSVLPKEIPTFVKAVEKAKEVMNKK